MIKRNRAFLLALVVSLIPILSVIPLILLRVGFYIGQDVNWIVHHIYVSTIIHGALGEGFNLLALIFGLSGLLFAPLFIILSLVFNIIAGKKTKLIIPAYVLGGLSLVITALSFGGLAIVMAGRHFLDMGFNIAYIFTPVGLTYYSLIGEVLQYQELSVSIVNVVFNALLMVGYLLAPIILILPFTLFVLSLVFMKERKKKAKVEESDVEIPLVEPEPVIDKVKIKEK